MQHCKFWFVFFFLKVTGDGECLFNLILKQLCYTAEIHEAVFTPVYLRRMLIVHYLKCRKENDDELFKAVRKELFAYGLLQEEVP